MTVSLRTGPPTKEELIAHYPAKFTWTQMKTFVNSGDLGLLKRDKKLQQRYELWAVKIKEKYGSVVNYLSNFRLQWGQPDTQTLLASALDDPTVQRTWIDPLDDNVKPRAPPPPLPPSAPAYFTRDTPDEYISIIQNDWPYSVPSDVEHTLIWTRIPIYHPTLVPPSIEPRITQDGLWGFTGTTTPPPSPSTLPSYLPALAEWGVTEDKIIRSPRGTPEEQDLVRNAGREVHAYVQSRWREEEWETAWFVNPPRLQSVPGLAHIHVFARKKH